MQDMEFIYAKQLKAMEARLAEEKVVKVSAIIRLLSIY
jgi:hypothetical protein